MTVRAYILVEAVPGRGQGIMETLRGNSKIKNATRVYGPIDIIVEVEAQDQRIITSILHEDIQTIPGIARTTTCFVVRPSTAPH